jgi:uncharacterized membrane protein
MNPSRPNPWLVLTVIGGLGYPFLVYFSLGSIPPTALVLTGLGLIGLRMLGLRGMEPTNRWIIAFALAGSGLLLLMTWKPEMAARAYPIAVSLAVAAVFALSLRFPPSIVERIARLSEPDLPPKGVAYTRRVTGVWAVFLLFNAGISGATAAWGSLAVWTLWNGFLSYVAMGLLFAGEYLVRKRVRRTA